ncbi:MAG: AMIN domain-containing protein [Bdellovibrionales bacterium]|nr:AMIN domain-containing protein [Bdellovibrionales bacterium]
MTSVRQIVGLLAILTLVLSAPSMAVAERIIFTQGEFVAEIDTESDSLVAVDVAYVGDSTADFSASAFVLSSPTRFVLDIAGITEFLTESISPESPSVAQIRLAQFEGKQRFVVETHEGLDLQIQSESLGKRGFSSTLRIHALPVFDFNEFLQMLDDENSCKVQMSYLPEPQRVVPSMNATTLPEVIIEDPMTFEFEIEDSTSIVDGSTEDSLKQQEPFEVAVPSSGLVPVWLLVSILGTLSVLVFLLQLLIRNTTKIKREEVNAIPMDLSLHPIPTLKEAYRVLGCSSGDDNEKLKANYRHLVKVFHQDALHPKQLPPELIAVSRREFERVKAAYTRLQIERPSL